MCAAAGTMAAPAGEGAVQLRRQLQAVAPELTLTQLPAVAAACSRSDGSGGHTVPQRPAAVTDDAAAAGILQRMQQLQAAAAALLQEQAAASRCAGVAAEFRLLKTPQAAAAGHLNSAAAATCAGAEQPGRQHKQAAQRGPSAAAAQRLAQLRQLQAAGAKLAEQLAA